MNRPVHMMMDLRHQNLNAYLRRIGAITKNFRRHVIEQPGPEGYPLVVAKITIDENKIICDVAEFAPTDEEREAISAELGQFPLPHSITASRSSIKWPQELKDAPKEHLFIYHDQSGDKVLMIQHRRNGEKPDLPYSFWSDGQWRCMEPDGLLPIYGLEQLSQTSTFFIHEGAKAARDISAMIAKGGATLAAHPWAEQLKGAAHLGWPGGATNAGRVDWEPIKKLPPIDSIVLICDHDQVGMEAATTISEKLRRPLQVIFIDDRFPPNFDLADSWPKHPEWWQGPKYIGPTFNDCLVPGTWATDVVIPPTTKKGPGRPAFYVRDQFAAEWSWVTAPAVFVHRSQCDRLLSDDAFNRGIRPFSNVDNTAKLLIRKVSSHCDGLTYEPGKHSGVINRGGQRLFNCYRPLTIKAIEGNPNPFLKFMKHLVPDDGDRKKLLRWLATKIACPEIRMTYGVLLISQVQGVGKGTLGEAILAPLLGLWNVSFPTESQLTDSAFNSWMAHKTLAVVHEIYSGHSVKAYNRLKSAMTDDYVDVNEKFLPVYRIKNFVQVFACSNSMRALHVEDTDRRWLIPRVTETIKPARWWKAFHRWLKGDGLGIILSWAERYVAEHGPVAQGEHAPNTSLKKEVIAEGRSDGERFAYDLGVLAKQAYDVGVQVFTDGKGDVRVAVFQWEPVSETKEQKKPVIRKPGKVVLAVEDVREWIREQRKLNLTDNHLEKSLTIRKMLLAAGLQEPPLDKEGQRPRFTIKNTRTGKSYIVANFSIEAGAQWSDLKEFYVTVPELIIECPGP